MTEDLICAPECEFPCATCLTTNPTECLTCTLGYSFDTTAIQNCFKDLTCNETVSCSGCPEGFILSDQLCFECNENCARC